MFLIDDMVNAWSTERTNEQAAINAKAQRDWQEKMWHMNNAYNDPSAQKARLEAAGINPYSVMAEGGADTGNSSSPADSVPPAPVSRFEMSNNVGFDILQALKTSKEIEGQDIANRSAETNLAFQETEKYLQLRETRARIRSLFKQGDLNEVERNYLETQDRVLQSQEIYLLKKSRAEANQAYTISQNLQREYNDRHFESVAKRQSLDAGIRLSNAQIHNLGVQEKEIYQRIQNLIEEKKLTGEQIQTEIEKQATEICNRVIARSANRREWKRLRANVVKDLNSMVNENNSAETAFGRWKAPQIGLNRKLLDPDWYDDTFGGYDY